MTSRWTLLLTLAVLLITCGCAYRYYLGFHGPSTQLHPDVHHGVTQDNECLGCHHPDKNPIGPPTSHPEFIGCFKCHND